MTAIDHENDRCPLDGYRRRHILLDGIVVAQCPWCGSLDPVEP